MKAMAFLLLVFAGVACALAQTFTVNMTRPAEAVKVASRLSVGTGEEEADQFMATNGLKVGYSLGPINGSETWHYYLLVGNHNIILRFSMSSGSVRTNRLLATAWMSQGTNWEAKSWIRLKNAPRTATSHTNAP